MISLAKYLIFNSITISVILMWHLQRVTRELSMHI